MGSPDRIKQIFRFLIIGGSNTLIDFGILFLLIEVNFNLWPANAISTSTALCFSFFANRSFTFRAENGGLSQALKFLAVTLVGLWVLQPLIIQSVVFISQNELPHNTVLLIGKLAATGITLIWNFLLYNVVVFKKLEKEHN